MKTKLKLTTRFALTAVATGALCFAAPMFAQQDQNEQSGQNESTSSRSNESSSSESSGAPSEMKSDTQDRANAKKAGASHTTGTASGTVTSPISKQDRQFMMMAAQSNKKEIAMGKLAQKQGNSEVKRLGMEMVTDHSQANEELGALAKMHQIKLDTTAPGMAEMKGGSNFDQQWLSDMVADHKKAIAMFQTEAKNGSNSRVMGYATTNLPVLQKHLRDVEKAQGKSNTSSNPIESRPRNS